jgi:hypothetical protein
LPLSCIGCWLTEHGSRPIRPPPHRKERSRVRANTRHQSPGAGPVAGTMDQVRPLRREQLARSLRVARLADRSSSDPIRWQPSADPGQKQDTGGRINARKGLTNDGPLQKPVLFTSIAGIRWRMWCKPLMQRRDLGVEANLWPSRRQPHPPWKTIPCCHSRCQLCSARR